MPRTKRKDKSRVVLRTGESQRADGTYHFSWTDANHKRRYVKGQAAAAYGGLVKEVIAIGEKQRGRSAQCR